MGGSQYISLLVDHPDTLGFIKQSHALWPGRIRLFLKIDTGYHRAGISPSSNLLKAICSKLEDPSFQNVVSIVGLYSHLGHSYSFSNPLESLEGLLTEFETLISVAKRYATVFPSNLHLSVGATPTATAAQVLASALSSSDSTESKDIFRRWHSLKESGYILELHAGVYPFLDLQQLATHARTSNLDYKDIGHRILVEVASLYPERMKPEALIAAGSLALGREPCKSYPGWGILSPWRPASTSPQQNPGFVPTHYSEASKTGWIVGRISQEHGILSWEGKMDGIRELRVGEKLLIWPNHACVAGMGFGWYIVVDSDSEDGDMIRDVWVRCRGW